MNSSDCKASIQKQYDAWGLRVEAKTMREQSQYWLTIGLTEDAERHTGTNRDWFLPEGFVK